ncbi:Stp1/IreP family PP2C-type Ser/Thr phosphatase [Aerococcus agrisoli]|uniref:protein-serine/threonine phosphatase n=1 Tax=Aerococcus agrisoli TaxID=2487350 RepID=A0A3N4H6B1_9LACT|nr:Stp1/IreP family PP2C-type Ser/Thr phosphatase [Aerococcus agrisoli]RPA60714.1 Stp1/IreP family PP2C-type Ser/Thr phosphatase [Aerococcus agrisoli]
MEIASKTDVGIERKQNQDQVGIFYNQDQLPILLLCDGMGGHNAGDVASEMAIFHVGHAWEETTGMDDPAMIQEWIQANVQSANAKIYEKANQYQDLAGMGTTIVAAVALEDLNQVILAHIGDSRIYMVKAGQIQQMTRDHSFVQELVDMAMITKEEAATHPQKNIVTRAVGIDPEVATDVDILDFNPGDILLMCSDGLTDMVAEDQVLAILAREYLGVAEKADTLIAKANENGGRDNVSVLIAQRDFNQDDYINERGDQA